MLTNIQPLIMRVQGIRTDPWRIRIQYAWYRSIWRQYTPGRVPALAKRHA